MEHKVKKFMLPSLPLPPIEELKLTWMWMDLESAMANHRWRYRPGARLPAMIGRWIVTRKRWVME